MNNHEERRNLIDAIEYFYYREYEEEKTIDEDEEYVDIAYTTYGDDEIEIQFTVDIVNNRIIEYIEGRETDVWQYDSAESLATFIIASDYSEMTALGEKAEAYFEELEDNEQ